MNSLENRESDERTGGSGLPFGIQYLASRIATRGPLNTNEHKIFTRFQIAMRSASELDAHSMRPAHFSHAAQPQDVPEAMLEFEHN